MINLIYKDFKKSKFIFIVYAVNVFTVLLIMAINIPSIYKGKSPVTIYNLLTILCLSQLVFLYIFSIKSNIYELADNDSIKFVKSMTISTSDLIKGKYISNLLFLVGLISIFILGIFIVQIISGTIYNLSIFFLLLGTFLIPISIESYLLIGYGKAYWNFSYYILGILLIINMIMPKFTSNLVEFIKGSKLNSYLTGLIVLSIGLLLYLISYRLVLRRFSHYDLCKN